MYQKCRLVCLVINSCPPTFFVNLSLGLPYQGIYGKDTNGKDARCVPNDETLAQRLQSGDRAALAVLVQRHHTALIGFLYRLTSADRSLAEDLAQETFVRALQRIGSYHYPRPFKAWLYAIATNLARDHYRRAETRRTTTTFDAVSLIEGEAPDAALLAAEEEQQVVAALRCLPDHQREVVIFRYYQALSLQEIADLLKIPVGTVKSRLSFALKALRQHLENI